MLFSTLRAWLLPGSQARSRTRRGGSRGASKRSQRFYSPLIDPLEERNLLTASVATSGDTEAIAAPLGVAGASVVGRNIFYNNSRFDGNDPAANGSDDGAIATNKTALLLGQTATIANATNYVAGINGIMIDIAGLTSTPTAADFVLRVGNNNDPSSWTEAPAPSSITVRPGAGVGGSSRVTLIWPDAAIRKQWLQVTVLDTVRTGLSQPDIFFFGNAVGDGGNLVNNATVNTADQLAARNNPQGLNTPVEIDSRYDYNRDGLVTSADEYIAASNVSAGLNTLQMIKPSANFAWTKVVGRNIFYNNSAYDGNDAAANAADDGAIATDKSALLPEGTATLANYTSYSRGINGIMIDMAGLKGTPTASDFVFRVGNSTDFKNWTDAPAPLSITVRPGAGAGGSSRVTIVWADNAIQRTWLQVTVKATKNTGLATPDVFYYGNAIGESGNSATDAMVNITDRIRTLNSVGQAAPIASSCDFNRDQVIDSTDVSIAEAGAVAGVPQLSLLSTVSAAPAAGPAPETIFVDFLNVAVMGRYVFYNNSRFDGNNPLANAADDQSIASDKSALLPGNTATFANYTSYGRGINGIMVDIAGLPGTPTLADFDFLMGTSADLAQWSAAPRPTQFLVRPGAGVSGSTRVTFVWPDNVIQNTWLQVTVKASYTTGLKTPDVFYFGNIQGESGNSSGDAVVDEADELATRGSIYSISNPAPKTVAADYNRDGLVDAADEWIAVRNSSTPQTALPLLSPPALALLPVAQREPLDLFSNMDGGTYLTAFGPNLVRANDGTLLVIAEGRSNTLDNYSKALIMRSSTDNGVSWSSVSTIVSTPIDGPDYLGNPSVVTDTTTGEIFAIYNINNSTVWVISSKDNGKTWGNNREITNSVKVTNGNNPLPGAYPDTPWGWYATGPGHAIQMQIGPYAGRMIIPANHRTTADTSGISWSHTIYSDDHGATWHLGGGLDQTNPANNYSNEPSLVQLNDGSLLMNIRVVNNSVIRGSSKSTDGGRTWSTMKMESSLNTYPIQAPIIRLNANTLLLAAPESDASQRHQMTIWMSRDEGLTWIKYKVIDFGYVAYSDMIVVGPDTVLLAYNEGDSLNYFEHIGLARFNLRWLMESSPYEFTWNFNEQAPGTPANLLGPSIQDYSPWDNRAQATADTPAEAPMYVDGPNGHTALALTAGSDRVIMSQPRVFSLEPATGPFTFQIVMRTTASNGVIIGSRPDIRNWTVQLVDGRVKFSVFDAVATPTIISTNTVNDGNWHSIVAMRDILTRKLRIYIDGVEAATPVGDGAFRSIIALDAFTLGSYNDGTGQLAFDVDTVRFTQGVVPVDKFITPSFDEPPRVAFLPHAANAPTSLPNLQFWLPAYDYTRDYSNTGFSDPVPQIPVVGNAVRSVIEASDNAYRVSTGGAPRPVLYAEDSVVGGSWLHSPSSSEGGREWYVANSNGATSDKNFDFVQNTGIFTLSMFIKPGANLGSYMALFDTDEALTATPGFSWLLLPDGSLRLQISDGKGARIDAKSLPTLISANQWYHIAVVGNGLGQPLTFYITSVNRTSVVPYYSEERLTGPSGNYPTDAKHNLQIGSTSNANKAAFNGQMVDQMIFDRAMFPDDIQKLFDYTLKR